MSDFHDTVLKYESVADSCFFFVATGFQFGGPIFLRESLQRAFQKRMEEGSSELAKSTDVRPSVSDTVPVFLESGVKYSKFILNFYLGSRFLDLKKIT
jgi:hypothetical protein